MPYSNSPNPNMAVRAQARQEAIARDAASREAVKEAHEMSGNAEEPGRFARILARFRRRAA